MNDTQGFVFGPAKSTPHLARIRAATRAALFRTQIEEFPLATNGGTVFLVDISDQVFGITCKHVLSGFDPMDLVVTTNRRGGFGISPRALTLLSFGLDHGQNSELLDIAVMQFGVSAHWFEDRPMAVNASTTIDAEAGEELFACGYLKSLCDYSTEGARSVLLELTAVADERHSSDVVVRSATTQPVYGDSYSLSGLSGAPVARLLDGKICGIVVRGGFVGEGRAKAHFVEFTDVLEVVRSSLAPDERPHFYTKYPS